jgi:hypothetical protein
MLFGLNAPSGLFFARLCAPTQQRRTHSVAQLLWRLGWRRRGRLRVVGLRLRQNDAAVERQGVSPPGRRRLCGSQAGRSICASSIDTLWPRPARWYSICAASTCQRWIALKAVDYCALVASHLSAFWNISPSGLFCTIPSSFSAKVAAALSVCGPRSPSTSTL